MIQLSQTRRLVEHSFDHDGHIYRVPGEFCLATSDVIELNGLSDVSMIPLDALRHASHRGTALHLAVRAFESQQRPETVIDDYARKSYPQARQDTFLNEVMERLWFYRSWRAGHTVKLAGEMEKPRVYRHEGTGRLIGATIDLPVFLDGEPFIIDLKTAHKQSGKKALQDQLKWKCQLQSYSEALDADDEFWRGKKRTAIGRMVLHLHPECGKNGTKGTQSGFEAHNFSEEDDSFLWDSAIRMAWEKYTHGYRLARRTEPNLKAQLAASLEEEAPIF